MGRYVRRTPRPVVQSQSSLNFCDEAGCCEFAGPTGKCRKHRHLPVRVKIEEVVVVKRKWTTNQKAQVNGIRWMRDQQGGVRGPYKKRGEG